MLYASDRQSGRLSNFVNYQRVWSSQTATEDVHARSLLALAHVLAWSEYQGHTMLAADLCARGAGQVGSFTSPRVVATGSIKAMPQWLKAHNLTGTV